MKILIVKRDKLGDLLLTTPMLAWLRKALPQAQIHVLANDYNAWILDGNPDVDKVWAVPRVKHAGRVRPMAAVSTLQQLWQLRGEQYDWVLIGNGDESPRAIKRGFWVKGKNIVAHCKNPADWPKLSHALKENRLIHESRALALLAEPLGLKVPDQLPHPRYTLPQKDAVFAQQWLAQRGLQPEGYVILGLGSRRARRQPTTQQVLNWAEKIHQRWGLKTVFMWTPGKSDNPLYPGDDDVAQPVLAAQSPHIYPYRGFLNEALGLIWHARSSVFPDSGLMHFAAASPGGVVGFFAEVEDSPQTIRWSPIGPNVAWLEAPKTVADLSDEQVLGTLAQRLAYRDAA